MTEPRAAARSGAAGRHFGGWIISQLAHFGAMLGQLLLVGVVLAMLRRQFRYRALAAALAVMAVGIGGGGRLVAAAAAGPGRDLALWGVALGSMAAAGFVAARLARTMAFWELYLASLVALAALLLGLTYGVGHDGADAALRTFGMPAAPGVLLLGPMWDRLVGLGALAGFLLALVGASAALLGLGDAGARDAGLGIEWALARRYLSGRGGNISPTAAVAVLGIALGVAALVAVTAVMSGYQQDIQAKILAANAHLVLQKYGVDFREFDAIGARARAVPGVCAASPFIFNEAMLSDAGQAIGVLVKGVPPLAAATVTDIETKICDPERLVDGCLPVAAAPGALARALAPRQAAGTGQLPAVMVGEALYRRLHLEIGDEITLTTPVGIAGARGSAPRRKVLRLGGVFHTGMYEFDARLVYLQLEAAQDLLGMDGTVTGIEMRLEDPAAVDLSARAVLAAVGRYPYRTLSWRELNAGIFTALKLQKVVMFLVLTFIVVVAAFNIASTLFMAVVEKAREIAILKGMGARDASIMKIFVIQGWLTGLAGVGLGVGLGLAVALGLGRLNLGIAADVYMVDHLAVRVRPVEVLWVVLAALTISHLATLYPALRAARQRPVDALRDA